MLSAATFLVALLATTLQVARPVAGVTCNTAIVCEGQKAYAGPATKGDKCMSLTLDCTSAANAHFKCASMNCKTKIISAGGLNATDEANYRAAFPTMTTW